MGIELKKEDFIENEKIWPVANELASQIIDLVVNNSGNIDKNSLDKIIGEYFSLLEKNGLDPRGKNKYDALSQLEKALRDNLQSRINMGTIKNNADLFKESINSAINKLEGLKNL